MKEFNNHYVHCGTTWYDTWDCMCNDECPICFGEIEPWASVEIGGEMILHVSQDFVPEDGWPDGITSLQELIEEVI